MDSSTQKQEVPKIPYRQIRAAYDDETITVYQAYSSSIAIPAVEKQKLSASADFSFGRMTWIKPSWCWMMYRAGYSYKDEGQSHILAMKMKREHFLGLLERAVLSHGVATGQSGSSVNKSADAQDKPVQVRVQWDPERTPSLEKLPYRSIQIGIPRDLSKIWVDEWITSIEDVTQKARNLKAAMDKNPNLSVKELVDMQLHPVERPFDLPEQIAVALDTSGED